MKIVCYRTWNEIKEISINAPETIVTWAMNTCWWAMGEDCFQYEVPNSKLPCDPRGSVLMQGELGKFIKEAGANPSHYGEHRLDALMLAYHGNLLTDEGKPTSFENWHLYNDLLNQKDIERDFLIRR